MLFIRNKGEILRTDIRVRGGGWLLVPQELEERLLSLLPYVRLTLDGDVVVGVEDDAEARANPTEPEPAHDPQADTDALLVDHEYRLTLLEWGVI